MSRIGRKLIEIPKGIKIEVNGNIIIVEGPKGKLDYTFPKEFNVVIEDDSLKVTRPDNSIRSRSIHGLIRSIINNMVTGVKDGFSKNLEIVGVGYKAQLKGKKLVLSLGFSHDVEYTPPEGITIETPQPTKIIVKGTDKIKVGEVAAEIRDFYRPEPYKGKGIKYENEYIRRKAGKAVA